MVIYLYKKTHNQTGLKYLGKTRHKNPHQYQGSGKYWRSHISKHGYDVNTEILKECSTNDEVREWGIYFSNLWNIVESDEWANLTEETGDGGPEGKSYEEIYGSEKSNQLKKNRAIKMKQYIGSNPGIRDGDRNPNAKCYEFRSPCGETFIVKGGLRHFCTNHNIDCSCIIDVLKGRKENHKGWIAKYL